MNAIDKAISLLCEFQTTQSRETAAEAVALVNKYLTEEGAHMCGCGAWISPTRRFCDSCLSVRRGRIAEAYQKKRRGIDEQKQRP